MRNASTGEPERSWQAWVKWLRLLGVALVGGWLLARSEQDTAIVLLFGALFAVLCSRLRLTAQRVELLIDGQAVQLMLYTDVSRRVWIACKSRNDCARACIMAPYSQGWVDHAINLDGKQYTLRILVKPFGAGYLVSNYGRGFDMVVVRNSWA
ncbi:hypothetical protein [Massilia sp.]|uniref:hypothetical protein n=1 Tax=Massilia sp. TaxID=1882437 RepID=UPI00391DD414